MWRLLRVSNVLTVFSNALVGLVLSQGRWNWQCGLLLVGLACCYCGGMALNDVCDLSRDRLLRPERPIPCGEVSRLRAFAVAAVLLGTGYLCLPDHPSRVALLLAIVGYDLTHRPWLMGLCRSLVFLCASACLGSPPVLLLWLWAGAMGIYTAWLTRLAQKEGELPELRPRILHGIALMALADAGFLGLCGYPWACGLSLACYALTRLWHRRLSGT